MNKLLPSPMAAGRNIRIEFDYDHETNSRLGTFCTFPTIHIE